MFKKLPSEALRHPSVELAVAQISRHFPEFRVVEGHDCLVGALVQR
jgi:hypothetical protein